MTICQTPECAEHYGCRLRAKGISLSPAASPTARRPFRPRPMADPSWEKGRAVVDRPDGSVMPILRDDGSHMPIKEFSEKRSQVEDGLRRLANTTTPLK